MAKKNDGLPKGAKKKADNHLAEGEHTGHFHDAIGGGVAVYEHPNGLLLSAPEGAEVTHQEHSTLAIDAGNYDVSQVLEFDHFAEEARVVRD